MSPILAVAIRLLAGYLGGWVAKWVTFPHVTGNILGGVLIGPAGLGWLGDYEQMKTFAPLSTFTMSLVAVVLAGIFRIAAFIIRFGGFFPLLFWCC